MLSRLRQRSGVLRVYSIHLNWFSLAGFFSNVAPVNVGNDPLFSDDTMLVENGFDSEDEAPPCNVAPVNGENDPLVSDHTMLVENGFDSEDEAPPCDLIIGSRIDSAADEDIP